MAAKDWPNPTPNALENPELQMKSLPQKKEVLQKVLLQKYLKRPDLS
jgi:hypothetical protein